MQAQTPRRLTAFTPSKVSAGSSAASVGAAWIPALLKAKSSRPKVATQRPTSMASCSSSETSQLTPTALVARGSQLLSRGLEGLVVAIGQDNGGASLGERLRRRDSHSRGSARDQRHAIAEVVGRAGHGVTMTLIDSRSAIAR